MRLSSVLILGSLLFPQSLLFAQGYAGSWTIPGGNVPIVLTLRQGAGQVTGTLTGQATMQVQARINGNMFEGLATSQTGRIYIAGQLQGADALTVVMGEVDAAGTPQQQTMRSFTATRGRGLGTGDRGPGTGQGQGAGRQGGGGGVATSPQDQQIAQMEQMVASLPPEQKKEAKTDEAIAQMKKSRDDFKNLTEEREKYGSGNIDLVLTREPELEKNWQALINLWSGK